LPGFARRQSSSENERHISRWRVLPAGSVLSGKNATRQMLVTARYSDGIERDVTGHGEVPVQ